MLWVVWTPRPKTGLLLLLPFVLVLPVEIVFPPRIAWKAFYRPLPGRRRRGKIYLAGKRWLSPGFQCLISICLAMGKLSFVFIEAKTKAVSGVSVSY